MGISESQLETWAHQGPTGQFTATYQTLNAVLHSRSAAYATHWFETFLQGSYANDTNVYADSDVDIVIWTSDVYYADTENLPTLDRQAYERDWSRAEYQLDDFKRNVVNWLTLNYGSDVQPGKKAIFAAVRVRYSMVPGSKTVRQQWQFKLTHYPRAFALARPAFNVPLNVHAWRRLWPIRSYSPVLWNGRAKTPASH